MQVEIPMEHPAGMQGGAAGYDTWISGVSILDEQKPQCGSYRKPETDRTVLDSLSSHPKAFPQVQELLPVLKCSV